MVSNHAAVVDGGRTLRDALVAVGGMSLPFDDIELREVGHEVAPAAGGIEVTRTLRGPVVASARLLDIEISAGDAVLHTMRGGKFEAAYPPEAFSVRSRVLQPRVPTPLPERLAFLEIGSQNGFSSDSDLPFFLVSTLDGSRGLWFAVSWSGSWRARLTKRSHADRFQLVVTGLGGVLELEASEEVVLPSVVVGTYAGDGWSAIRDHLATIRPRPMEPLVVYNTWFNENAAITEERLLKSIEVAAEVGVEVVTLDGAWYDASADDPENFTTTGVGTWTPDAARFPRGLGPVSDAVRAGGMVFGLWCEIERAHPESDVATAHPDWLRVAEGERLALLDLGIPDVVDWCADTLIALVDRWSVGWLKLDHTSRSVSAYWAGDARAELAHIRGLYEVYDRIREMRPDLIIEGCAGGGTRIDREMVARCDSFWLSDQTQSPDMVRAVVANARRILPAQYCYLSISPGLPEPSEEYPVGWYLGVMPGVFGIMDPLRLWPPSLRAQATAQIATHKRIRPLLNGVPTRFAACSESDPFGTWDALEVANEGGSVLFAHRLHSDDMTREFEGRRRWIATVDEVGGACLQVQ